MAYLQRWHGWCHMKLLPSRRVLCTPYNHAPCHFMQSHIRKVHACLVVTCHLHFRQKDRGLLRATAVTRGWNGYRNKSQHRKLTLEKKTGAWCMVVVVFVATGVLVLRTPPFSIFVSSTAPPYLSELLLLSSPLYLFAQPQILGSSVFLG